MPAIDVFNGDADGICALHQLRLANPRPGARLVTGPKRDIRLLSRVRTVRDQEITVLDISLDRNRDDLIDLLQRNNKILYIDHHYCGEVPASSLLTVHIDPAPTICTSMIVDRLLEGRYRAWAVVGAFGDNLDESATQLARQMELGDQEREALRECGQLLNYNGYGAEPADLYFSPEELYRQVSGHADPLVFHRSSPVIATLRRGFQEDMKRASSFSPLCREAGGRVFLLPGEPWARRVAGVFSNELARQEPDLAHALLMPNRDKTFRVSVRAPLNRRRGADELCRRYPGGGGRAAAAGINRLPADRKEAFLADFIDQFSPTNHA